MAVQNLRISDGDFDIGDFVPRVKQMHLNWSSFTQSNLDYCKNNREDWVLMS